MTGVKGHVNWAALNKGERLTSVDCVGHLQQPGGSQGYCFYLKDMDTPDYRAFASSSKVTQHKRPDHVTQVPIGGLQSQVTLHGVAHCIPAAALWGRDHCGL